jgi:arylsulfatase A-like enzyme
VLGFLAACSAEEEPPRAVVHLLDEPCSGQELPDTWLAPEVDVWLERERVPILDELVEASEWRPLRGPRGSVQTGWRAAARFPVVGARRVRAEEAPTLMAGEAMAADAGERPGPGMVSISSRGLFFQAKEPASAGPELHISYESSASSLRSALLLPADAASALAPRSVSLGEVTRRVLMPGAPARLRWSIDVPPGARLAFAFGLLGQGLRAGNDGLHVDDQPLAGGLFQVELATATAPAQSVFERELAPTEAGRFHEASVDLAAFAGQHVELVLSSTLASGAQAGAAFPFWAEPVLLAEPAEPPLNILVLLIDTLRADRLGCYGWERAVTPHIDSLARAGVRFDDVTSAASWTLPSHASLFSSLYASEHGVNERGVRLAKEVTTLAEVLRAHGYLTAAFVEGGFVHTRCGFDQGFDTFDSTGQGTAAEPRNVHQTFGKGLKWIEEAGQPWFAFLHTYELHSPYDPELEDRARLVRSYSGPLPSRVHPPDYPWGRGAPVRITEEDTRYLSDLYDAEIAYTDRAIGDVLRFLEEHDLARNTLVVLTSDHGEEFGDHGHFGHGFSLYQEQLRVPLLLRLPGRFEGGTVLSHPVHGIDLAPTLVELAGANVPAEWSGVPVSLTPSERERELFVPFRTRKEGLATRALRAGKLKYIDYAASDRPLDELGKGPLLFDLEQDPSETTNLWSKLGPGAWRESVRALEAAHPARFEAASESLGTALDEELDALGYGGGD